MGGARARLTEYLRGVDPRPWLAVYLKGMAMVPPETPGTVSAAPMQAPFR